MPFSSEWCSPFTEAPPSGGMSDLFQSSALFSGYGTWKRTCSRNFDAGVLIRLLSAVGGRLGNRSVLSLRAVAW